MVRGSVGAVQIKLVWFSSACRIQHGIIFRPLHNENHLRP